MFGDPRDPGLGPLWEEGQNPFMQPIGPGPGGGAVPSNIGGPPGLSVPNPMAQAQRPGGPAFGGPQPPPQGGMMGALNSPGGAMFGAAMQNLANTSLGQYGKQVDPIQAYQQTVQNRAIMSQREQQMKMQERQDKRAQEKFDIEKDTMYEMKDFVRQNGLEGLPFEEQLAKFKEFKTATTAGASNRPTKTWTGENGNMMYLDATGNVVDTGVKGSPPGSEIVNVGGVSYVKETLAGGEPRFTPLDEYQTSYRKGQIEGEEGSKVKGRTVEERNQALLDVMDTGQYDELNQGIENTRNLLTEMESGAYDGTGPIEGVWSKFWGNPETARLQFDSISAALQNLKITNLAPVTEQEIKMIQDLYASIGADPAQNVEILKRALRMLEQKKAIIDKKSDYFFETGSLEGYGQTRFEENKKKQQAVTATQPTGDIPVAPPAEEFDYVIGKGLVPKGG